MRNERNHFVTLLHAAVLAVFRKQMQEHQQWLQETAARHGSGVIPCALTSTVAPMLAWWRPSTRSTAAAGLRCCWASSGIRCRRI